MKNIVSKFKIFLIALIVLVVVGMALLGALGFNKSADYRSTCELYVSIDQNVSTSNSGKILKDSTEEYLKNNGVNYVDYATETLEGDGITLIYKIDEVISDGWRAGLDHYVSSKLASKADIKDLNVDVQIYSAKPSYNSQFGWILLAFGIAIVVLFVYTFFMEKLSSALTLIIVSVISSILFISLMAITRIPAYPYVGAVGILSALLSGVLSTVMLNRFKEQTKLSESSGLSIRDIANKGAYDSILRFAFILGALLFISLFLIIIGPAFLRFIGLQILIAGISSVFVAFTFTPVFWMIFKSFKKKKN